MIIAPLPLDEQLRLQDLYSYDILDTHSENDFDELVELASQICKTPISLITLLDKDRQWFKAKNGLTETGTARDVAFCSHAILQDEVFVVEDAAKDERFCDNPLVTGDLNIRFYAGAPIISPSGNKLGTICIIDNKPKTLSKKEERALLLISNQVTKLLEIRRKNILIRKRAKEIIALKSKLVNDVVLEKEINEKALAANLHEDFAQLLASSILYLNMAETQFEKKPFIDIAKKQLHEVLAGLKSLSYKMSPPVISWLTNQQLVEEFIEKISATFPFQITLTKNIDDIACSAEEAGFAMRIIEQWLKILMYKSEISIVNISIATSDSEFTIAIEDDSSIIDFAGREKEIFNSIISDTINSKGGIIDLSVSSFGTNLLKINIPLVKFSPELAKA